MYGVAEEQSYYRGCSVRGVRLWAKHEAGRATGEKGEDAGKSICQGWGHQKAQANGL